MGRVGEAVPNLKIDLRRPGEGESRKKERNKRQEVIRMMRQHNTYTERRR